MLRSLRTPLLFAACLLGALSGHANNIQIANSALVGNAGTSIQVQFDLSWENSWRLGSGRWDAAWVFVKYRTSLTGPWYHANVNNTGHVGAAGSQIDLGLLTPGTAYNASTNPVVGVFVYRNAAGTGNLSLPGTQLQWNFAAQGLDISDIAQVQVFAIEMVYVPQGGFYVGSGGTEDGSFTDGAWTSGNTLPFQISSENALTIAPTAGNLWGTSSTGWSTIGGAGVLPATFPKGFNAFYCMKYEVTQQGYADFLNTLTYAQQVNRAATAPTSAAGTGALVSTNLYRNGIDIRSPGLAGSAAASYACNLNANTTYGEATDGKDIACNWLSWGDLTAYLDWSGLRPMTELEFEKACRGTIAPVPNEYPWGTTTINNSTNILANAGAANEAIVFGYSGTLGNAAYQQTIPNDFGSNSGPVRVGIFAANAGNTGRVTAGASYYGIMELGGNVNERSVTVGNAEGRAFTATHGNGTLVADGNPDAATWPSPTTTSGSGFRGASWSSGPTLPVSNRADASGPIPVRLAAHGGRGVRAAP